MQDTLECWGDGCTLVMSKFLNGNQLKMETIDCMNMGTTIPIDGGSWLLW